MTRADRRFRTLLLLPLWLVALALAFRIAVDGVMTITEDRHVDQTTIPTVVIEPHDAGITPHPKPHLLRDA